MEQGIPCLFHFALRQTIDLPQHIQQFGNLLMFLAAHGLVLVEQFGRKIIHAHLSMIK